MCVLAYVSVAVLSGLLPCSVQGRVAGVADLWLGWSLSQSLTSNSAPWTV